VSALRGPSIVPRLLLSTAILASITLAGCGGSSSGRELGGTDDPGTQTPSPGSGPITVASGQTITAADISVPVSSNPINATLLGTNSTSAATLFASNTGGAVQRGTSVIVLMFGTGFDRSLTVSISGPSDLAVSNVANTTSTQGTPGIQFTLTAAANAAVGARTVTVRDSQGNVTAFTGGLEVF